MRTSRIATQKQIASIHSCSRPSIRVDRPGVAEHATDPEHGNYGLFNKLFSFISGEGGGVLDYWLGGIDGLIQVIFFSELQSSFLLSALEGKEFLRILITPHSDGIWPFPFLSLGNRGRCYAGGSLAFFFQINFPVASSISINCYHHLSQKTVS
jgi:hypothetical protein